MPDAAPELTPPSPAAVARLVENHRAFLGFLERRLGDRAVAEDILQDAFVRGLDKLGALEKEESAVAWFYRLLRNAVIDHARRESAQKRRLDSLAAELNGDDTELTRELCKCVGRLADNLKPEYAEALRRVELEGLSMKQFAALAGISSQNAAVRVFRAREALRKQVSRSCGACAEHGCLDCSCASG